VSLISLVAADNFSTINFYMFCTKSYRILVFSLFSCFSLTLSALVEYQLNEMVDVYRGDEVVGQFPAGVRMVSDRQKGEWAHVRFQGEDGGVEDGWISIVNATIVEAVPVTEVVVAADIEKTTDGFIEPVAFYPLNTYNMNNEIIMQKANQGHPQAQFMLAELYHFGTRKSGFDKDVDLAIHWFHKSANQGYPQAQFYVGSQHDYGFGGVKEDDAEAVRWYRMAAQQGYAKAQFYLAICYFNGEGVDVNNASGESWLRLAANQGEANAQYLIGLRSVHGNGVPQNREVALKWLKKAAEQKHGKAISLLKIVETR